MAESIKDYGIKYRVIRLDEKRCLLFPVSLVKGEDLEEGFQTNRTIYSYASTEEDFKNKYIVDNVCSRDELEFIYEYEGDEDFLGDYFFDDHKDTILFVDANDKEEWCSRREINLNTLVNKKEIAYMMNDTLPSVVFNEEALKELSDSDDLNEVKLLIKKYKKLLSSFAKNNKEKGVTKINVINGKVDTVETNTRIVKLPRDVKVEIKDDKRKSNNQDISYVGLRDYLKERIYGHDEEVETIALKLYMNYTAIEGEKVDSFLIVGPTGTGKTETIKAAATYLGLPFAEANSSNLVPQGIVGTSIEDILMELYTSAGKDLKKAERGIIFLDEFDKVKEGDGEVKGPVKNILLTFTAGGKFPLYKDDITFNTAMLNKVYAGVFERIQSRTKQVGFNASIKKIEPLGSEEEIRKKIIDKGYFTLEELSRISRVLAYDELDRETKKKILLDSKLSEFAIRKSRYKRQFDVDLIADMTYIDAIINGIEEGNTGMRSVNNIVARTIDTAEKKLAEVEGQEFKKLIVTSDTVEDPKKFILK